MKIKSYFSFILLIIVFVIGCKTPKSSSTAEPGYIISADVSVKTLDGVVLHGTLDLPKGVKNPPVALIIAGSGPTDRNGNQPRLTSNIYKILADSLAKHGIATLRYDKRGIGQSKVPGGLDESKLRFQTYANDAADWIRWLKNQHHFSKIIVIGHSEGSLLGILAIEKEPADMFISLEGAGRPIDQILKEQLQAQPKKIQQMAIPIIDSLKQGKTVKNVPKILYSLFRPSVQPYLISWMKYDPAKELAKLNIPILIIHGTTDIQVPVHDAKILAQANKNAKLVIIEGMNHVLRKAPEERLKNLKTYTNPDLPVMGKLVQSIVNFIKTNS